MRRTQKKTRTREHIIADLSTNFVEKQIILSNNSAQRVEKDYGYDLQMFTYNESGETENGMVYLQLKATDKIKLLANKSKISLTLEVVDIIHWSNEVYPVYIILYDAQATEEPAYWCDIRKYISEKQLALDDIISKQATLTINLSIENKLDVDTIKQFQVEKNREHLELKNLLRKNREGDF